MASRLFRVVMRPVSNAPPESSETSRLILHFRLFFWSLLLCAVSVLEVCRQDPVSTTLLVWLRACFTAENIEQ